MKRERVVRGAVVAQLLCILFFQSIWSAENSDKAPRPGHVTPAPLIAQAPQFLPHQEQQRDATFRRLEADTLTVHRTLTADTINAQHFTVVQTTLANLDVLDTLTTKNILVTNHAQINGPLDMAGNPIINISNATAQTLVGNATPTAPAAVLTGQGTTDAPALRLLGVPNTPLPTDTILVIDASGNLINSGVTIGSISGGTSGNVPGVLVKRDLIDGGFAAGTIVASLFGNVTGNVTGDVVGDVSGAASANVLRSGDTMTGTLRILNATAPALQLLINATSSSNDYIVTIDPQGNVTQSTVQLGSLGISGTSSNIPGMLVQRDSSGNFEAGTIQANLFGNATGNVSGTVNGGLLGNVTGNVAGSVLGDVTGNVAGNLFGNVLGDVTGNVVGNIFGNVTGNVVGNLLGDVTGNVVGNVSGAASENVLKIGDTMTGQLRVSDPSDAAIVATGQSTTQAPALRLVQNPATQPNDLIMTLDPQGNVTQSTRTIISLTGTSGNVPLTLVLRDGSGNFATSAITLNNGSTGFAALNQAGDAATGLYFPQSNQAGLLANGLEPLRVNMTGVGMGTTEPFTQLTVGQKFLAQGSTGTNAAPYQIFVQGRYAYVVNATSNTLQVINVSNQSSPTPLGSVTTANNPLALHVNGTFAYLATDTGSGTVQIIDVSNPSAPRVISTLSGFASPASIYVQGPYAYVIANSGSSLYVIDASNPSAMSQAGVVNGLSGAETVYVQGRYAYLACSGSNSVVVVDLNDPNNPVIVGSASTGGASAPQSIDAQGRYAYVVCSGNDTFNVVDVGNPSNPIVVGTVTIPGGGQQPWDVFTEGRYAYIVTKASHLIYAIDVSNPASPQLVGSLSTGGADPRSLYVQGRYAYVVNSSDNSLQIIDLGGAYIQQLEAGGIETGTLATRSDASLAGELDVRGGVLVGRGLLVSRDVALEGKVTTTGGIQFYDTANGAYVGLRAPATVNTGYTLLLPTAQGTVEHQLLAQSATLGQLTWLNATSSNVPNTLMMRDSSGALFAQTVTANLIGNVSGNLFGTVFGNVTGNVVGNLFGDVTGNVVGNVSGAASANVLKIGDTMSGQLRVSDATTAALVATGQSTTQAPALRLVNNPTAHSSDVILAIDNQGNVTRSTVTVDPLINATSSNVPNTLVVRDNSGSFAAGAISAGLLGNVTGNVSGQVTGSLIGNVTGSVFGNVLGNVTGTVFGGLQGNVTGNVVGNLFGDVTGNVVGNVSGAASANVLKAGDTMSGQLRISDLGDAALVATGQSTTQAPALRLVNNPVAQASDVLLAIDSSGNVTRSTVAVDSMANATSGAAPNTLVLRDNSGNFAANTISAGLLGNVTGNVSGQVTGSLLGNVTGSVFGNVLGNVTGTVFGGLQGNVTGNVVGNLFGDVTGNVVGNVSGAASANVLKIGDTMSGQLRVSDLVDAALVATGQSTTQAPALRLVNNPTAQSSDVLLAIDSSGNVTRSTVAVDSMANATSGAVPNTLVLRDSSGNFAANVINAGLFGNVTGNVSGQVTGSLLGNVTGNVFGNVLGNVTGTVFGGLQGNVTGNVVGNLFGDVTGNVVGNVSGAASANVLKIGDTMTGQLRISDLSSAALVATGQSTTQAPALRLLNNPAAQASDLLLAIDSAGNVTRSATAIPLLTNATSSAVPNTLALRDVTGSFAANVLNLQGLDVLGTSTFRDYVYSFTVAPSNVLYVQKERITAPNQFNSIKAAVDSIVGNSATNPYIVEVGPGVYVEDTITLKSYVGIRGDNQGTTIIEVNAPSKDIINGASNASLRNLTLRGATNSGQAAVVQTAGILTLQNVHFGSSDILIKVRTPGAAPSVVIFDVGQILGTALFTTAFDIVGTSALLPCGATVVNCTWSPTSAIASGVSVVNVSGPGSFFTGSTVSFGSSLLTPTANTYGAQFSNGATFQLTSALLEGFATAFSVPVAAAGPHINLLGVVAGNNTTDLSVQDPQTLGAVSGEFTKTKINIASTVTGLSVSIMEPTSGGITMVGPLSTGRTVDVATNVSPLINDGANLGMIDGGLIYTTTTSLVVTVSAGSGYLMQTTSGVDNLKLVSWPTTTTTVVANTDNFIAITNAGIAQVTLTQPSIFYTIPLGKVRAWATGALFVEAIPSHAVHTATYLNDSIIAALGPVYVSGSSVTGASQLNVTAGAYVFGNNQYAPVGGSPISWQAYLGAGTNQFVGTQSTIDYQQYDANGVLTPIPTNFFARHELYVIGGVNSANGSTAEQYALVYSQTVFPTLQNAEVGDLPTKPSTWTGNIVPIASIIVQNDGLPRIVEILDERPRPGFVSSSVAGVTVHGNLLGLAADDHKQYLLVSGARAMTGSLNMGTNQITNAGTINGVTIELHGARHGANSLDPIPTGVVGDIQPLALANAAGTSNAFARADHVHAHSNLSDGSLHALADSTTAGFMSAADKLMLTNATPSNTPSTLVLRDSSGNFSAGTISTGLQGNVTGNVVGNLVGNVFGNVTGNVVGNVSGAASANVLKVGDTMTGQLRISDATRAALVVTGHSTTAAPAVRLVGNPSATATDKFVTIDSAGNVSQIAASLAPLTNATSSNVANTLVLRDGSGNFATGAITLNAGTTGALALNFSGSAGTGLYSPGANQLALVANNAQKLYANTTGVGIGTSAPFTQLTVAGSLALSGSTGTAGSVPVFVYVQGRYAYVANNGNGTLSIIDVGNPLTPSIVGTLSTGANPRSVYVQGRYAYVGNYTSNSLSIIDVSNPSSPVVVGTQSGLNNPQAVYVQGRYAYVANYTGNSLSIIDVGNPSSPVIVGTKSGLNAPISVYVQGRYAYVANNFGGTMSIIDVSNPSGPVIVGTQSGMTLANSVYVQGRYAYIADVSGNALRIIDVGNPTSPSIVGTQAVSSPLSVYVQDRYAYVVNATTVVVVDISNPSSPSIVGLQAGLSSPSSIFVQGRYAYIANLSANRLQIIDLGGAYIQQLEVGGIEAGTLATRENGAVGNDLDVRGGMVVGRTLQVIGDAAFDGRITTTSDLLFYDATGGQYVGLRAPTSVATSYALAFPTDQGSAPNQVLAQSTTLGQLAWLSATSSNIANTLAMRDSFGNFTAGTINAGLVGNVTGNVTGNLVGNVFGNVTGNVVGNVSGSASANVLKIGDTMTGQLRISDATRAALVATGQSTTTAPALRLTGNPTGTATDTFLTIDGAGNVAQTTTQIGALANATSSNIANRLVLRDSSGNFAAGTISAGLVGNVTGNVTGNLVGNVFGNVTGNVIGNVSGVASANVLKIGDTMTGQLRISDPTLASLVLTGQSTTTAPALRLVGNPTATAADNFLTVDGAGNVSQIAVSLSPLTNATSSNVANTLVLRDGSGNFATSAMTLNAGTTGVTSLNFANNAGTGLYSPGANQLALVTNSAQQLYANSTGVGIGTSAPFTQLTVGGTTLLAGSSGDGSNRTQAVYVQGRYAYVLTFFPTAKLLVFDVSDANAPTIVGSLSGLDGANYIYVQGRYAYVIRTTDTLVIIDISNPSSPCVVATQTVSNPQAVYVQGSYAYVTSLGSNALVIVDVSKPTVPVVVGQCTGLTVPYGVYVQGRYAYVGNLSGGSLFVIDVNDPRSPRRVGTVSVGGSLYAISVQGRYAYTINGSTLGVVDVSNPSNPILVTTLGGFNGATSLSLQDRYAYVVNGSGTTMSVIDISNPSSPSLVRTQDGLNHAASIFVQGRYAYVANYAANTLQIIDLGGASIQQLEAGGVEAGTLATRSNAAIGNDLDVRGGMVVGRSLQVQGDAVVDGKITTTNGVLFYDATGGQYVGLNAPTTVTSSYTLTLPADGGAVPSVLAQSSTLGQLAWLSATSGSSPTSLVLRDGSGNFAANSITLNAGTTGVTALNFAGNAGTGLYSPGAHQLALVTNNTQQLYVNSTGVGIGTSAPFTQLTAMNTNAFITGTSGAGLSLTNIYLQGRYAYVTDSNDNLLRVFDVSNPNTPFEVGRVGVTSPQSVVVQGRYAYVGQGYGGDFLRIFDVSNPSNPVQVGSVGTNANPYVVCVQGRYVYVANFIGNSAQIFDVGNPEAPTLAATISLPGAGPLGICIYGRYLYVAGTGNNFFYIIDVSNPANPVMVSQFSTGANSAPWSISVQGSYAYLVYTGSLRRLQIIDISNPSSPVTKGSAGTLVESRTLTVQGRYAYVQEFGGNNLEIFDVSDPNNPIRVGIASAGGSAGTICVQGRYAYVAKYFGGGLAVLDLGGSYIQQLETGGIEVGTLATRENCAIGNELDVKGGVTIGKGLQVEGDVALDGKVTVTSTLQLLRTLTAASTDTLLARDGSGNVTKTTVPVGPLTNATSGNVANTIVQRDNSGNFAAGTVLLNQAGVGTSAPFTQLVVGARSLLSGATGPVIGALYGIYVQGRYAYIVDNSGQMSVIDVSNSSAPATLATVSTGGTVPFSVYVQGRYAYVTNYGSGVTSDATMAIFDVSNPANPVMIGSPFQTGGVNPIAVYVQGRYAYVLNSQSASSSVPALSIIDVSNPNQPVLMGTPLLTGGIFAGRNSIFVQGRYAYITSTNSGRLVIVDVQNPSSPVLVATLTTGFSSPSGVYVQGRYAYVIDGGNNALAIVDVKNPAAPSIVGSQTTGVNSAQSVYVQGRYAYVVTSNYSIVILDVSSPTAPFFVEAKTLTSPAYSLFVQGRYAYVGTNSAGLQIVDLGGAYIQQLEAGGIETGTLATRENAVVGNDLDVKGGAVVGANLKITGQLTAINASGSSGTAATSPLRLVNLPAAGATDNYLAVDSNGNLGTVSTFSSSGTSSNVPNTIVKFDSSGNFAASAITLNAGSTGTAALNFAGSAGTGLYAPGTNQIALAANSAQKLYANNTGIGIGTSAPFTQLTVGTALSLAGRTGQGGSSFSLEVYVQGRYAYVANGDGVSFRVVDVSDSNNPVPLGGINVGPLNHLYVQGRYAYGISYSGTLFVIDISNPSNPSLAGTLSVGFSQMYGIYVQGRYAYLISSTGTLGVVDVSNPCKPTLVGSLSGLGQALALFVQGRYAYVIDYNVGALRVIDVGNPAYIALVSSLGGFIQPVGIYVQGRYAYVVENSGFSNRLSVIDVSNPASLVSAGSLSGLSSPSKVFVQGRYAYVIEVTGTGVLRVIDVSNPSAMVSVTSLAINAYSSVFVQGRFAYAVDFDSTRLQIVDLGGAYIQQLEAGGLETGTLAARENVAIGNDLDVKGGGTIARGLQATGNSNILGDFVVTNTNIVTAGTTGAAGTFADLYVQGRYAYVTDYGANFLRVFDVSNPGTPTLVGSASITSPQSVFVQGRYAYVAQGSGGNFVVIFDISNPSNPVQVSSVGTASTPYALYVQGRYAYVANSGANSVQIFDVSDPLAPFNVATVSTASAPRALFVQGRYLYASAETGNSIYIIDVSNPTVPTIVNTYATGANAGPWTIYVQGRYAYVIYSGTQQKLQILDISNPSSPVAKGSIATFASSRTLFVQDRYAYVADFSGTSMEIFDVSNPDSPIRVGAASLGATGSGAWFVQGRYAYIARYNGAVDGLMVLDLGGAYVQQLEAGGIETGTLATRSNAAIGNDFDVKGGVAIGRNLDVQGQITAINATGSGTGTATTSPLRLTNLLSSGTFGTNLGVDANFNVGILTSSARFKEHIRPLTTESDLLYSLTPVKYDYKPEYGGGKGMYGFIAEDVAQVYPAIINYDETGLIRNYNASTLHAPTIKEVQKQHKLLNAHETALRDHATSMFELLHADDSLQTALSMHDARLRTQMTTIQALLVTIASMQSQLQALQNR